jgi:hypothetical protein
MTMKVGFLHSLIRPEEKLLIKEFENRPGVELAMIDTARSFNPAKIISLMRRRRGRSSFPSLARLGFESAGAGVNTSKATICGDKILTPSLSNIMCRSPKCASPYRRFDDPSHRRDGLPRGAETGGRLWGKVARRSMIMTRGNDLGTK